MKAISDGQKLPSLVDSPQAGAAEALYGLGASIGRRGGEDLALIYLQLALYLQPSHAMALLSLGDLYEDLKKPDLAIKAYERVPASSPLSRNAEIQMAVDLDALDRTDEAKQRLQHVIVAASQGHRGDHRARQYPARAQGFCRAAPTPTARPSIRWRRRRSRTGSCSTSAAFATSARINGRRPKPI